MLHIRSNPARNHGFPLSLSLLFSFALPMIAIFCSESARAKPETTLPVSFYCFNYAPNLKSIYIKSGEATFRKIDLSIANIVDGGQSSVKDGWLVLYGPQGDDGEHPSIERLEIKSFKEPLIILSSAEKNGKATYDAKAIEGNLKSFPMGGYYFVNLLPHAMKIKIGDTAIELGPNENKMVEPKSAAGEVMPVTIEYLNDGHWLLASSARWSYRLDRRTIIGVRLDPRSKRVVVKSIPLREP